MEGRILAFIVVFLNGFTERSEALKEGFSPLGKKSFQRLAGFGVLREMFASI